MSKLNLLVHLNGYEDTNTTNCPSLSNFNWSRDYQGLSVDNPQSKSVVLAPGEISQIFSGEVTLLSDITTEYDLSLKTGTSNTYVLQHSAGTAPNFKTLRSINSDATTEVTITKNARILTYTSTGGTLFDLSGVSVGDEVRIGTAFNTQNVGKFTILSKTATSFTVENEFGQAEGPIVLGATFEDQVRIYSIAGVQIGNKIEIVSGFSPVTYGTYEITDVADNYIEFYNSQALPEESGIINNPEIFTIYSSAKSFLYIESSKEVSLTLNGSNTPIKIKPFDLGTSKTPGIFLLRSTMKSIILENTSNSNANLLYITTE